MDAWEREAKAVAALSRADFRREVSRQNEAGERELLRARFRWRIDEYAAAVIRPELESQGATWSSFSALDEVVYGPEPVRPSQDSSSITMLLLAARGSGKTSRVRVRARHAAQYGIHRCGVFVGPKHEDGIRNVDGAVGGFREPSPVQAWLYPDTTVSGGPTSPHRVVTTPWGSSWWEARGFTGAIRGINIPGYGRPTFIGLDDIEHEDNTRTPGSRDTNGARIRSAIKRLPPPGHSAEIWWPQTPAHHDAAAARFLRRDEGYRGFRVRHFPGLLAMPDNLDAWNAVRDIHFAEEFAEDPEARDAAIRWYVDRHRDVLMAGCVELDPVTLPAWKCFQVLWDDGQTAFDREIQVSPRTASGRIFDTSTWPRIRVDDGRIHFVGSDREPIAVSSLRLAAHYDPSDGGDDGALSIVGADNARRRYEVGGLVMSDARLSVQVPQVAREAVRFYPYGLRVLHWEPPPGAASTVERDLRAALADAMREAGHVGTMRLERMPSRENKNARIVGGLEPLSAASMLHIRHDLPMSVVTTADDFDPARTDNRDDWLDALQRAVSRSGTRPQTGTRLGGSFTRGPTR